MATGEYSSPALRVYARMVCTVHDAVTRRVENPYRRQERRQPRVDLTQFERQRPLPLRQRRARRAERTETRPLTAHERTETWRPGTGERTDPYRPADGERTDPWRPVARERSGTLVIERRPWSGQADGQPAWPLALLFLVGGFTSFCLLLTLALLFLL